jgi:hypothetical protein
MPVLYFHVIFTIPDCLHPIAMANQRLFYNSFFKAAWATISTFARNESNLKTGMTSILHTWGSNMFYHPHLHCIGPGGGVTEKGEWKPFKGCQNKTPFLFPVHALSRVFRAKMLSFLTSALREEHKVISQGIRKKAMETSWVVYSKAPAKGVDQVLEYIGRYAYRVAISNSRIKKISKDGMVTYDYKDYRAGGRHKEMTVSAVDFRHLFSMHILPEKFVRIRHNGLLSPSNRDLIRKIQRQLHSKNTLPLKRTKLSLSQISEARGWDIGLCPCCKCKMEVMEYIEPWTRSYEESGSRSPPTYKQLRLHLV